MAPMMDDQWPMPNSMDEMPFEDAGFDSYEFLCNGSWGVPPSRADPSPESPYDDTLAPDTGKYPNDPKWIITESSYSQLVQCAIYNTKLLLLAVRKRLRNGSCFGKYRQ